jgi:hypothetical protein
MFVFINKFYWMTLKTSDNNMSYVASALLYCQYPEKNGINFNEVLSISYDI